MTVTGVGDAAQPRRFCRERERTRAGEGVRAPDLSEVEDPDRLAFYEAVLARQREGEWLPAWDRLLRDSEGVRLWVRTLGREMADRHPILRLDGRYPRRRIGPGMCTT